MNCRLLFVLFYFMITFSEIITGQPYIFRVEFEDDSINNYPPQSLSKINLKNHQIDNFINLNNNFYNFYTEQTNKWIFLVNKHCDETRIVEILDTSHNFLFVDSNFCFGGGIVYSNTNNKIYFFEPKDNKFKLLSFDINNGQTEFLLDVPPTIDENYGNREAFLSRNENLLYFLMPDTNYSDTVYNQALLCYYSTTNKHLNYVRKLSELGLNGADGYSMKKGRNGKTIVNSFFLSPNLNHYYRLYDLDNDTGYVFINNNLWSTQFIIGSGEYILFAYDSLVMNREYHTGNFDIYNSLTGEKVKTVSLPSNGSIYTFDNYPNDVYYVINLDTQPVIYNLTRLELHSISPAIALYSPTGQRQEFTFNITAYGGLFTDSTVAFFNNQPKPTTKINDTTINFTLSNNDITSVGNYPVWISNYGSNSDTLIFTVAYSLTNSLIPTFQCVRRNPDKSYTAFFGYNNSNSTAVFIPTGPNNKFSPSPDFRGQPNVFIPGNQENVFSVNFNGDNLTWLLAGYSVTVNKNSNNCP